MVSDFYDGMTSETKIKHRRMSPYIELAEKQGDAIYMDGKPWELKIIIRKPKEIQDESDSKRQ